MRNDSDNPITIYDQDGKVIAILKPGEWVYLDVTEPKPGKPSEWKKREIDASSR